MSLHQFKEDYTLFLEAGFIAVNQADEDAAMRLFKACDALRPESPLSKIGYGYLHLHKLELKQACKNLEEALEREPSNEVAKALLGLCMSMQPKMTDKGAKILEETAHSSDPTIKQMSNTAIHFVDKFVRKEEPPLKSGGAHKSSKKNHKKKAK